MLDHDELELEKVGSQDSVRDWTWALWVTLVLQSTEPSLQPVSPKTECHKFFWMSIQVKHICFNCSLHVENSVSAQRLSTFLCGFTVMSLFFNFMPISNEEMYFQCCVLIVCYLANDQFDHLQIFLKFHIKKYFQVHNIIRILEFRKI